MPRFPFFNKIHEKLEEAKISDLNHELGKLAQGSAAYWGSFKANSGSLFKAGSSKLWSGGRPVAPSSGLSKSVSLPTGFQRPNDNNNIREESVHSKYQYRSSVIVEDDEDFGVQRVNPGGDSTSVVDRFIRVIESKDQVEFVKPEEHPRLKSREEIRRKLASGSFGGADFQENSLKKGGSKKTADLEVCYINETAFDDDPIKEEDEEDVEQTASEVQPDSIEPGRFPRSKSDWEAFRNPTLLSLATPKEERGNRHSTTLSDLQAEAALALTNCQSLASRKLEAEKRRRELEDSQALKSLIGRDIGKRLTPESLEELNCPTIQVIWNNYLSRIERLNEELVNLLLEKDELQIEQDSQLVDIDDLSQPSSRERRLLF